MLTSATKLTYATSTQVLVAFLTYAHVCSRMLTYVTNTQVLVAFLVGTLLILWLWRKEVCPYSLVSLY